ncbi:MAG: choice-of-anchor D domain-containing protein [Terriglobales bacterium]
MNPKALRRTEVKEFRLCLRSVLFLASCMIVACFFMVASSVGQAIFMPASNSIVSLAASPKPEAESVARRASDSRFENAPTNYHVFPAVAVGEYTGVEELTLNFAGETTLTRIKSTNQDFVIERGGTCQEGDTYARGESCSLLVRFSPQGPGHRLGFIKVSHTAEAAPASFGLTGNGYAPVVSFTPSQITTVPGTVSSGTGTIGAATSLAVDGGDILYIADTGNNKVKEMDSSGVIITTTLNPIATPASITVDSFGILYTANVHGSTYYFSIYYPWGSQTAYGYAYTSATCTPSAPCAFSAVGMNYPANISIDAYDDLFFEEGTTGAAEMPVANISGGTGSLNLWHLSDQFAYSSGTPGSFAVDASGNLYTGYHFSTSTCYLLEESLYNAEYSPTANRVAGGVACGFTGDGGQARGAEISSTIGQIAFDVAGDLYFSDTGNNRVRRIEAGTGIIRTIAGNGSTGYKGDKGPATKAALGTPTGLAVDSQGQVYILNPSGTAPAQAVRKVGTTGSLTFSSTATGSSSSALHVNVANTGNASLNILRDKISGTNSGDFSIDSSSTNCNFDTGNSLAAGHSCQIGVIFKPAAAGSRTATLTLVDNTVDGVNKVSLSGTATTAAKVKFTAPAAAQLPAAQTVTVSVIVTAAGGPEPAGTVDFSLDGKVVTSATLASQAATANLGTLAAGTHRLTASYLGDKYHPSLKKSETITVTQ